MENWAEWVWIDGRLVRGAEATVSVFDRGFLLGDGLFETLRVIDGRLFRLERHLARLQRGAAFLRIPLIRSAAEWRAAIQATLEANQLSDAAVRLTVTRGSGPPGPGLEGAGPPLAVIAVRPFTGYPAHRYDPGARASVSRFIKYERSPLAGFKTTSFLDHVLARAEAAECGTDEALLLNTRGDLVEGSSTNLFVVIAGHIRTPDLASGCLPGVTREVVLELAHARGLEFREEPLRPDALASAGEAFLTNSLLGIAPLSHVDGLMPDRRPLGPITQSLAAAYRELVAREAE